MFDLPDESILIVDTTKLKSYVGCARRCLFEHIFGWRSTAPNNDMVYGSATHAGLAVFEQHGINDATTEEAVAAFLKVYRKDFTPQMDFFYSPKNGKVGEHILRQYANHYKEIDKKEKPLYIEQAGSVLVAPHLELYFKLDAIKERNKQTICKEHKTLGNYGYTNWWIDGWLTDFQPSTYIHVLHSYGFPSNIDYIVEINGLCIKTAWEKQKPQDIFKRFKIKKTPDAMDLWLTNITTWYERYLKDLELLQKASVNDASLEAFATTSPYSCYSYWKRCPYMDICVGVPNPLYMCGNPPEGFVEKYWDPRKREDI